MALAVPFWPAMIFNVLTEPVIVKFEAATVTATGMLALNVPLLALTVMQ